jgi:hypothetical protein
MNYVGFCVDLNAGPTQWGPSDVMGYLIAGDEVDGWRLVKTHLCSSEHFAEGDIRGHFKRADPAPIDLYRWEGMTTMEAMSIKYRPAAAGVAVTTEQP